MIRLAGCIALATLCLAASPRAADRPDILILIADDLTWSDLGCTGNKDVRTPNIDRLASEGMRFSHCFTPTAMCSPTRQALYTGLFPVRNGAYPNHSRVKPGTKTIVQHLGALGYTVGLKGKSHVGPPQAFAWKKVNDAGTFLEDGDGPKCLIFASNEPHLPWQQAKGFDPAKLTVPPYLVDTPETRRALSEYYTDIAQLDDEVGEMLKLVEGRDTIVLFTSEQGAQFPFGKWTCYELGLRTTTIVRWPGRVKAGTVSDAMVQYPDILPTLIEAAGGKPPEDLDGRSFLSVLEGKTDTHGEYAYGIHTTQGIIAGKPYPVRSVRSRTHRYIRNLMPEAKFHNTLMEHDKEDYWKSWVKAAETDEFAATRVKLYQHRPAEELYDLTKDPYEFTNVADKPGNREILETLRARLDAWMEQQGDKGIETELAGKRKKKKK